MFDDTERAATAMTTLSRNSYMNAPVIVMGLANCATYSWSFREDARCWYSIDSHVLRGLNRASIVMVWHGEYHRG